MKRIDDQKILARRARELARLLRGVDPAALDRPLADGETMGALLADAEKKLLSALIQEGAPGADADPDPPKIQNPSWLPKRET